MAVVKDPVIVEDGPGGGTSNSYKINVVVDTSDTNVNLLSTEAKITYIYASTAQSAESVTTANSYYIAVGALTTSSYITIPAYYIIIYTLNCPTAHLSQWLQ